MKRGGQQRNQRCMNNNNEMRKKLIKSKIKKCKNQIKETKKTSIATLIPQQQQEVDVFDTLRGERQTETVREA